MTCASEYNRNVVWTPVFGNNDKKHSLNVQMNWFFSVYRLVESVDPRVQSDNLISFKWGRKENMDFCSKFFHLDPDLKHGIRWISLILWTLFSRSILEFQKTWADGTDVGSLCNCHRCEHMLVWCICTYWLTNAIHCSRLVHSFIRVHSGLCRSLGSADTQTCAYIITTSIQNNSIALKFPLIRRCGLVVELQGPRMDTQEPTPRLLNIKGAEDHFLQSGSQLPG